MKKLLLKSGCGALVAAAATLAPLTAHADDIWGFAGKPILASPHATTQVNVPPTKVKSVLSWDFVTYEMPAGAQGPMRTEADEAAERALKRALAGFGGEGTS